MSIKDTVKKVWDKTTCLLVYGQHDYQHKGQQFRKIASTPKNVYKLFDRDICSRCGTKRFREIGE